MSMAIQAQFNSDNYNHNFGFQFRGPQGFLIDNSAAELSKNCPDLQWKQQYQQMQQQQQQQLHSFQQSQNQRKRNRNMLSDQNTLVVSTSKPQKIINNADQSSMSYLQSIFDLLDKQREDIDQYIRSQNERLRLVLQEQRNQQVADWVMQVESKVVILSRQKDEEMARATKRRTELEESLIRLEAEKRAWQRVAQEKQAMVLSLSNTLQQLRERVSSFDSGAEDAGSCCDDNMGEREKEEEEGVGGGAGVKNRVGDRGTGEVEETRSKMMVCRVCKSRRSCVLLLPCRHLCSCNTCAESLEVCPVCNMSKKASILALIF